MKFSFIPLFILIVHFFGIFPSALAQTDLSYYLPEGISYDPSVPTPKSVIGHEVGEWHISHDKLVAYLRTLAQHSDRIELHTIGHTFEHRPQLLLTITSPENLKHIEDLRQEHVKISDPGQSTRLDLEKMPAVVYMGYSIHGNEPSGSNAALLAAYHLAAAQGPEVTQLLDHLIILLDPSLNPDGLNRFASWVNSRKSKHLNTDPNNMEQNEPWPTGRTNHYWFDLNRDWLTIQLPESQARIAQFHHWKPNLLTDHHEMNTNSTYFFQPGIPSRNHPLTPENTYLLTGKIAAYHAQALDEIGSLYYSKESFDDFYFGKGSTYPDINGGVGILFEQASSRSHAQKSVNGIITFPFTIKNHFTTTLSTLKAAHDLRVPLLEHQRDFYLSALDEAGKGAEKAYFFSSKKDPKRSYQLARILKAHQIEVYKNAKSIGIKGEVYPEGEGYVVPLDQKQYRLIKAMFETRTSFKDSLFYDVSSWTLPLAFGVTYQTLDAKKFNTGLLGTTFENEPLLTEGKLISPGHSQPTYAYAFEWHDLKAPGALYALQEKGLLTKVATRPFTTTEGKEFGRGSIIVPSKTQKYGPERLAQILQKTAEDYAITIHSLSSGYSTGANLGSPAFKALTSPKNLLLIGSGVNAYEAGEIWHLLDQRHGIPLSLVDIKTFDDIDPSPYNNIIMVDGTYSGLNIRKLKNWVKNGGNLISQKGAGKWLAKKGLGKAKYKDTNSDSSQREHIPYELLSRHLGSKAIGGAIFQCRLDLTHPIAYGYEQEEISVLRNSTLFLEKPKNPFASPMVYTETPLLSGYVSDENLKKVKGSAAVSISSLGLGRIITFSDNPNFRAFWLGTHKLFLNSIFFGHIIDPEACK